MIAADSIGDIEKQQQTRAPISLFYPFLGFAVPTVLLTYGLAVPRTCMSGVNMVTVGFGTSIAASAIAYWLAIRFVLRRAAFHKDQRLTTRELCFSMVPLTVFTSVAALVAYGFVIPRSCIAGVNEHTIGFGVMLLVFAGCYVQGVRVAAHRADPKVGRPRPGRPLRIRYFYPLVGFVVPTAVLGLVVVIPKSCGAGTVVASVGFGMALVGGCIAYWQGVRLALRGDDVTQSAQR